MSILIQPFKCDDVQVKFGLSCEKQKEMQDSFNNLSKSNTLSSAFSVGSEIGGDPLGLNFEEDSKKLSEKFIQEFENNINWSVLIDNQRINLSVKFIKKNIDKMNNVCFKYNLSKNIQRFMIKQYRRRKLKSVRSLKLDRNLCNNIISFYQK
jgi:hypothetical protein